MVKEWISQKHSQSVEYILRFLKNKCNIGLEPTQSRWGFISILLSIALFFIALSPALYAIYLFWGEGWMMAVVIISIIAGIIILLFAIYLSVYLLSLRHQNLEDPTQKELQEINKTLRKIANTLRNMKGDLNRKRDSQNG